MYVNDIRRLNKTAVNGLQQWSFLHIFTLRNSYGLFARIWKLVPYSGFLIMPVFAGRVALTL